MKKLLLCCTLAAGFIISKAQSPCNFTASILPAKPIFCPNGTDTLYTQKYDSYQWLKEGQPIPGATQRYLVIHQQEDQGMRFKVAVTLNGCKDTSKRVIPDGYAFTPPILIEGGDIGVFDPKLDALVECPEDTLILTLGGTYSVNIQWYNNQKPIPGANDPSYDVVSNGSYTVCGAPSICPNYIACESLPLNAVFENPTATITQKHDTLFASPAKQYQWLLFSKPIPGATQQYYVPKVRGSYRVATVDKYNCSALSDAFAYTQNSSFALFSLAPNPARNMLHVNINTDKAFGIIISDVYGNHVMQVNVTGKQQDISLQNLHTGNYIVQLEDKQHNLLSSVTILKQ